MQRNEGKEHRNSEICELTVSNSEHKGSGHHPECCHQQVLLIALWCLGMSHQYRTPQNSLRGHLKVRIKIAHLGLRSATNPDKNRDFGPNVLPDNPVISRLAG